MLSKIGSLNSRLPYVQFATAKQLLYGITAREQLCQGIEKLVKTVETTYGPKGRNVIVQSLYGQPKITKDGVTVARSVEVKDHVQNMGCQLVKQAASRTNDIAGDGTTCCCVLTQGIISEGIKNVQAGINPIEMKKGIDQAVQKVVDGLKEQSVIVKEREQIINVATISANGDKEIGTLIADLMEKVGEHGSITVSDGKTLKHEVDFVEGMRFDRGFISPYFVNDKKRQQTKLDKPLILITDKKIASIQSLLFFLEHSMKKAQPLLIICEDLESEALATLVVNKLKGSLNVCAVRCPSFGDNRKAILEDIAILTKSKVVSEEAGVTLEEAQLDVLGQCDSVLVTKDDTIIMSGIGEQNKVQERVDEIKEQIANSISEYDKEKLKERLAKLKGGVGVIKVGGASEVEVGEIKDRVTDALNATKAAKEQGIVVGGGCALLYAAKQLQGFKGANFDQNVGIDIVKKAIKIPVKTIVKNAGYEGEVVAGKLEEENCRTKGFNAATGSFVDMFKEGIIDPTKVIKSALVDSSSVASMVLTTEAVVANDNEDKQPTVGQGLAGGMP